ncbi:hypothetical protein CYMTET_42089, partial [Cymbomonas tetramitiformis]
MSEAGATNRSSIRTSTRGPYKSSSSIGDKTFEARNETLKEACGGDLDEHILRYISKPENAGLLHQVCNYAKTCQDSDIDIEVNEAVALFHDFELSKDRYKTLRRHVDGLPSVYKLIKRFAETDIPLTKLLDDEQNVVGYAVTDVLNDIVIPELQDYLRRGGKRRIRHYKHGVDNFSFSKFDDTTVPCEQYILYMVDPDEKANSVLKVRPLAFCYNQKECFKLMKIILAHIDHQLPRGEVEVTDPTNVSIGRTLRSVQINATCHIIAADLNNLRTLEVMTRLGKINQKCHVDMTIEELNILRVEDDLDQLFTASGMDIPNWSGCKGVSAGLIAKINQACKNQAGPPLTLTPPERYVMDACHWLINWNRNWRGIFLQKLAQQIGRDLKTADETKMDKPRPMKGWDATCSQTLMLDSEHTNNILLGHPFHPAVRRVSDSLATLTRLMTKSELSEQDIQQYRTICANMRGYMAACFGSYEKYCQLCTASGVQPQVFQEHLKFNVGCYEHSTMAHAVPHLERHKSFVRYSSWVIEAMNTIWKSLLLNHTANGGGSANEDPGLQTLRRVLRMSSPTFREFSQKTYEDHLKRTYICGLCNGEK